MKIGVFLNHLIELLSKRESNYRIRLLKDLYEDETGLLEQIVDYETRVDANPDDGRVLQLYSRVKKTRKLINRLEDSETI